MERKNIIRIIFYFLWLSTLLLQAYRVELRGDEAYYWMYAKNLAWGYFDHPPVTAVLVKAGYLLFHNELGVRLFFVLVITATVWIMEKLIRPVNFNLFYAIVLSVAFLQLGMVFGGGMYAIPDFPLLFFTALFFYLYKQYLDDTSWIKVVLLSGVICLLLLSKYHGILVIGFTLLSNLALLKRKSFWVMVVLSVVFFMPHLIWQLENDFPSVNYHLYERSSKGYSISYTLEYLLTQPFILGPFISVLLIYLGIAHKPGDLFERSMKYVLIGTYVFFFFMTFKGRVEGNWTVIALVPLLYLGYHHILISEKLKKLTYYILVISLLIILPVRILLIAEKLPSSFAFTKSLGARSWANELKGKSLDRPVAFMNSYQRASLYEFYTGMPAFSLNNVWGRKNQYSLWDAESTFQGKSVALVLVADIRSKQYDSIQINSEYIHYYFIDNFRSTSNLDIQSDLVSSLKVKPRDSLSVTVKFSYRNDSIRDLEANLEYPSYVSYSFFQHSTTVETHTTRLNLKNNMIGNNKSYTIPIITPELPGQYDFFLSVQTGSLPPGINSERVKFIVE
jgi:hypothetical protein